MCVVIISWDECNDPFQLECLLELNWIPSYETSYSKSIGEKKKLAEIQHLLVS